MISIKKENNKKVPISGLKENRKSIKSDLKSGKVNKEATLGQKILNKLQQFSKSLMFPIAMLPAAALLNRFGALMSDTSMAGINEGNFI
jgi:hypothetical protein